MFPIPKIFKKKEKQPMTKEYHNSSISEILTISTELETVQERIDYLKNHKRAKAILTVFKFSYNKQWESDLPKGKTKYKPFDEMFAGQLLYSQLRKLNIFVKDHVVCGSEISKARKESLWFTFLESIDKDDAEMMVLAKDGKIFKKFNRITAKFAEEVFPGEILLNDK